MTRINWRLYFKEFSRVHGGNPVLYQQDKESGRGGYLLFRDGWMYSRSNPSGPEYAPTSDEDALRKARDYWLTREAILEYELRQLKDRVQSLARAQDGRSASLMTTETYLVEDDDGKQARQHRPAPIDFDSLLGRCQDLASMIEECQTNLADLRVDPVTPQNVSAGIKAALEVLSQGAKHDP